MCATDKDLFNVLLCECEWNWNNNGKRPDGGDEIEAAWFSDGERE